MSLCELSSTKVVIKVKFKLGKVKVNYVNNR